MNRQDRDTDPGRFAARRAKAAPWVVYLVALLAGLALAWIQYSTPYIVEFDGYYHIKMADLLREQGFIGSFPWLPFTTFSERYADMHLPLHYLLVPFTFLGLTAGAKLYAVVSSTAVFLVFAFLLRREKVPWAPLWVLVLLTSSAFVYRFSLPRMGQLSVLFLLVGLILIASRRNLWLFFLAWLFTASYVAFPVLLLFAFFDLAARRMLGESGDWRPLVAVTAGIAAGLVVNPYFPDNVWYYYTQAFQISAMQKIPMGGEWKPWDAWRLLRENSVVFAGFFLAVLAILLRPVRPDARKVAAFLSAVFFLVLAFKARRFIEYFVPFSVLFSALALREPLRAATRVRHRLLVLAAWVAVALSAWGTVERTAWEIDLYAMGTGNPLYEDCARWLGENTPAGSLVFHTDWDDFPALFFYNTHNRYIVGLDPNFLYLRDPRRWQIYAEVARGNVRNPGEIIEKVFGAAFIFTDRDHDRFLRNLREEGLAELRFDDGACAVYEIAH